ncbi:hypothetical protein AMS68_005359 [Peltaster fructicola]|uniref:FAD-binding FR-type domain-containing protein n=1 Tax=Peltaster fructicola TaxID=286661 RepID=A0A6H0XYJ0_9PEZI|nr:hypothetical protein AMS68_005359 [Peltaster fructicola]
MAATLEGRHIQNLSEAAGLEPHWGYVSRAIPCTNDAGSCAYLDLVYASHDRGMLYSGILWITILTVIFTLAFVTRARSSSQLAEIDNRSALSRYFRAISAGMRKRLLPDAWHLMFGRATRLQVTVLLLLAGYLIIWTFVGMTYQQWMTPVKNKPGVYNTRTTLGPWSDRVGILAYALTPLSVLLGNRESLLSVLTGIPYQKLNFLHRWLGWIIFVQSALHTIGWCIVEIRLYQPQPQVAHDWIIQTYMIWGVVAMTLLTILIVLSTPWGIRLTGYEFFRKAHYVLAMVYIGACWGHWEQLKCFLLPSLLLWFVDRAARLVRTGLLHYQLLETGSFGFEPAQATITLFQHAIGGDVLRLDLELDHDPWHVGQHYYLCFPESSIWQSHPFTPLNAPKVVDGKVKHSYILRAKNGETKKLAKLAASKSISESSSTSVVLTGAYGEKLMEGLTARTNIICIAGGTGITYVLPVLLELASQRTYSTDRQIELVWAVRHANDLQWIELELETLRQCSKALNLHIRLYATRDCKCGAQCSCGSSLAEKAINVKVVSESSLSSEADNDEIVPSKACTYGQKVADAAMQIGRPNIDALVKTFLEQTICGRTVVLASGPGGMLSDARQAVASCNNGRQVLKGHDRYDVDLICDDRLEW